MTVLATFARWERAHRAHVPTGRVDRYFHIITQGDLPNPGSDADFAISPQRNFPSSSICSAALGPASRPRC